MSQSKSLVLFLSDSQLTSYSRWELWGFPMFLRETCSISWYWQADWCSSCIRRLVEKDLGRRAELLQVDFTFQPSPVVRSSRAVNETIWFQMQADEMRFLRRVSGFTLGTWWGAQISGRSSEYNWCYFICGSDQDLSLESYWTPPNDPQHNRGVPHTTWPGISEGEDQGYVARPAATMTLTQTPSGKWMLMLITTRLHFLVDCA